MTQDDLFTEAESEQIKSMDEVHQYDRPLVTIGTRARPWISIFGQRYGLRRPDEGTIADQQRTRLLGRRLEAIGKKANLTEQDQQVLTDSAREVVRLLLPELSEETVKFLTISELAEISTAWSSVFGPERLE